MEQVVPVVVMRRRRIIRYSRPKITANLECCNWRSNYKELARGWKCEICGRVWNLPPKPRL